MIDEMRHFLLVVEHGTFTEAARRARLTQPSLSASIARLELALGARVLERGRHGAAPTAAGEALIPRAREAIAAVERAAQAVADVCGLRAGEVRLAAGATVCAYYLPAVLKRFREKNAGVAIRLREMNSSDCLDALHEGTVDLALLAGGAAGERWRDDPLVLVGPPGATLEGAAFVTFPRGANSRAMLDRLFPDAPIAMELSSIATMKAHLRSGMGVALLSRAAVEYDLANGRLALIEDPRVPVSRSLRIVHRGVDRLSPAASALRTVLRDEVRRERTERALTKRPRVS